MKRRVAVWVCCALLVGCLVPWQLGGTWTSVPALSRAHPSNAGPGPASLLGTGAGCTSFLLADDGQHLFGTNRDSLLPGRGYLYVYRRGVAKRGSEPSGTGQVAEWVSRYASVGLSYTAPEHSWSGMNEAGLAIGTMHLPSTEMPPLDTRPTFLSGQWVQYQLDNHATVEQVIASEAVVRLSPDQEDHFLVCDRKGECAVVEFIAGQAIYTTGPSLPVKVLTNTAYATALAALQDGRRRSALDISLDRFLLAARMLGDRGSGNDASSLAYAFKVLARVGNRRRTEWSIVYDLQALRVYWRTRSNQRIRCLDLGAVERTCATPIHMLDLTADLAGDVAGELRPYSHEDALAQLLWFVREVDLGDTEPESAAYIAHVESYGCVQDSGGGPDVSPTVEGGSCADAIPPLPARALGARWGSGAGTVAVAVGAAIAVAACAICWTVRTRRR